MPTCGGEVASRRGNVSCPLASDPAAILPARGRGAYPVSLHEQSVGRSDEWYTPPHVFEALGVAFDLDVSSPGREVVPWIPARHHYTKGSLDLPWEGFVWMNPPFGKRNGIAPWLCKFFEHGRGIALTPDRTSAPWWAEFAKLADAILFVSPKLHFVSGDGRPNKSPAQGTCLMAAGQSAVSALCRARLKGLGVVMFAAPQVGTSGDAAQCAEAQPIDAQKGE